MTYEIAAPNTSKSPGARFVLLPNVRAVSTYAASGVARAFTDADGSLKACYFKTMLHLELPASWERLSGQHKSGEAL
ncbi:hypothetical protein OEZ85_010689 [Tetradesmus obliquus]|uniref:PsbP C-terminal domain-containing protein n=1 Tax=Tetradesmus obliquus TaxID=3088 RepID=A0ABY8TNB0_TETOB|nr:hypothetical protein OEZ85_010689 [Tetradesmus obliquus]